MGGIWLGHSFSHHIHFLSVLGSIWLGCMHGRLSRGWLAGWLVELAGWLLLDLLLGSLL
jgi:hypothetical protein